MENEIKDLKFNLEKFKSNTRSEKFQRELVKLKGEFLKHLVFINNIPELKGLNREVKRDGNVRNDIERLKRNPKYFVEERRILVNRRNMHIIDGQHTVSAGLKFMSEFGSDNFEVLIEFIDIPTISAEERIIREINISRNWRGKDFYNQGLNSRDEAKKGNYNRFDKVLKHLEKKFESETVKRDTLITISGHIIGIKDVSRCVRSTLGYQLKVNSGQVVDSIKIINDAFKIEKEAMKKKDCGFSLNRPKFWKVFRELYSTASFLPEKLISYISTNYNYIEWWDDNDVSVKKLRTILYDLANESEAISLSDYLSLTKQKIKY